jgi:hypothetical protein
LKTIDNYIENPLKKEKMEKTKMELLFGRKRVLKSGA